MVCMRLAAVGLPEADLPTPGLGRLGRLLTGAAGAIVLATELRTGTALLEEDPASVVSLCGKAAEAEARC